MENYISESRPRLVEYRIKKNDVKWTIQNKETKKLYYLRVNEERPEHCMHAFLSSVSAYETGHYKKTYTIVDRERLAKKILSDEDVVVWIPENRENIIKTTWVIEPDSNYSSAKIATESNSLYNIKLKGFKSFLGESSLSRVWSKMAQHDCGTITSFRKSNSRNTNMKNNSILLTDLRNKGYSDITPVQGKFVEELGLSMNEVGESVFFVCDSNNRGKLESDLFELGVKYKQDSIMFIKKPGDSSVLIGTNNSGNPGMGKRIELNARKIGASGKEGFSSVGGRSFKFYDKDVEDTNPYNNKRDLEQKSHIRR